MASLERLMQKAKDSAKYNQKCLQDLTNNKVSSQRMLAMQATWHIRRIIKMETFLTTVKELDIAP